MEINEKNSLVAVRIVLQNKRACSLKAYFKLNTILQHSGREVVRTNSNERTNKDG